MRNIFVPFLVFVLLSIPGIGAASDAELITLGDPITVSGAGAVVAGSTVTIVAGGAYRITGTLADGMVAVDTAEPVELILDGVAIGHSTGPAIWVANAKKVTLVLADGTRNTLSDGATYAEPAAKGALFSNDTLEITGGGALAVTGRYKHGIASDDDVIVTDGQISVAAATDGIHANDNITVRGGSIQITQANDGLESEGTLVLAGGELVLAVAEDGIVSADTLTIDDGKITVTAGVEGIESKNNILVTGGQLAITVSDDALNATNDITVQGGQIYAAANGDALDSNGTLHMAGGVTVALGGASPEGGLDCDMCTISFTGGIVVATGGAHSTPASTSTQHVVMLGSVPVGSLLHIEGAGTDVLTFQVAKSYQSMVFSSPALAANTTYTAYTGGTAAGGSEFHGRYSGATYTGGSVWLTFTTNTMVTSVGATPGGPDGPLTPPGPPERSNALYLPLIRH